MTTPSLNFYDQEYEKNKEQILKEFFKFLSFESISTLKENQKEILACANWLKSYLTDLHFETEIWESPKGHPSVFAQNLQAGNSKPTVLIYLHYDVQPVDPLNLWDSPPFKPTLKGDNVFARGACDNKGHGFLTFTALKYLYERHKKYPVNIKLIIEGEEECGSKTLPIFLEEKKAKLQADYLLIVDMDIPKEDVPTINVGSRGIIPLEFEIQGSNTDLHSGLYGGIVYNPLRALSEILAKFYDKEGKVTIPGFYDDIKPLTEAQKKELYLDFDYQEFEKELGTKANGGEKNFSPLERMGLRPTFEINGMWGGYISEGFKTVIPSLAHAKVSMRLVPNQKPEKITKSFESYLKSLLPEGLTLKIKEAHPPAEAFWCDFNSKIANAAQWAMTQAFQKPCKKYIGGGSLPIAPLLQKASNAQTVGLGVALSSDKIHAPNEHLSLTRFKKGYLMITQLIEKLAEDIN